MGDTLQSCVLQVGKQILTASILQALARLQPALEPSYSLRTPDRNQVTASILKAGTELQQAFSRQELSYSLPSPDRNQGTVWIKLQPPT